MLAIVAAFVSLAVNHNLNHYHHMCKLAGWTSSKQNPLPKSAADAALRAAHEVISKSERDGFGYAQSGTNGLRGKFVSPKDFKSIYCIEDLTKRAGKGIGAFKMAYQSSLEGSYVANKSTIVHGRTATCGISITNVHPFRRKGWTLAHNGVVNWDGKMDEAHKSVTCDSEHLLIAMSDHTPTPQRKEALEHISGYAAFLALNPQGKMVVAVDDRASLYAGITSKGRWIFGTTAAIVEAIADAWNAKGVTAYAIDDWAWLEFDAKGGDPDLSEWSHRTATARQLGFASQSLGETAKTTTSERWDGYHAPSYGYSSYSKPSTTSRAAWLSADEAEAQRELLALDADELALLESEGMSVPDYK